VTARRIVPGAVALLALAALPLVAARLRPAHERCEMDGVAIKPLYRVRVRGADGRAHAFCGVRCAALWIAGSGSAPADVRVTDTTTGTVIDARAAWFVETVANRGDGAPDTIRVFARKEDAESRVRAYGGRILAGSERPFGAEGERDAKGNS
jgi:hypothetical protein